MGYQIEEKYKSNPVNKVMVRRENQALLKALSAEGLKIF